MYKHFGKAVIRTPLFTYNELIGPAQPFNFELLLQDKLNDPYFMEALYWASPELYKLSKDLKENLIKNGKKKDRLLHSLKKYIIRAASRSTPYGIFAGCDLIDISLDSSTVRFKRNPPSIYRKIRPDMGLLVNLTEHIKNNSKIWPYLSYQINNSLYCVNGTYRYMEYHIKDSQRDYQLNAVEQSPLLDKILKNARNQALKLTEFCNLIDDNYTYQEKLAYIEELIQIQFLVCDLQVEVISNDQLKKLKTELKSLKNNHIDVEEYLVLLENIETVIDKFECAPIGVVPVTEINLVKQQLEQMKIQADRENFIHADLIRPNKTDIVLSEEMIDELLKATKVLSMFSSKTPFYEEQLKQFKSIFIEKYDTQEIPLAEVSDMEMGIGFPAMNGIGNISYNPFTEQIKSPVFKEKTEVKYQWHEFLREKTIHAEQQNQTNILITDKDLQPFKDKTGQLANTISLLFSVLPDGQLLLHSAGGTTANSLLGRFAYLNPETGILSEQISDKDKEFSKDAILAEIIHLPEGRAGNIIRRPALSNYEIPFLAKSGLADKNQIQLDDLMISVQYDKIILRSKRLNKHIIPRLSCAHNYSASKLPVYQLLSALQHQGKIGFQINWGLWAKSKEFLPRITYGNVIFQLASWNFKSTNYSFIIESPDPIHALQRFLKKWAIPRYVALTEGDNELFIDTEQKEYLSILLEELRKNKPLRLIEWLHFNQQQNANEKAYVNQFILPLYREENTAKHEAVNYTSKNEAVTRVFPPGSEWIYFKIYCGAYISDRLLSEDLDNLSRTLLQDQLIDKFFFIRYTDPNYHIRYRFHLKDSNASACGEVIKRLYQSLESYTTTRTVWKIQLDTYRRELERYDADHINATENIFFHDSILYLNLLKEDCFQTNENIRLLTGIKNIDKWLISFNLDLEEKISFTEKMSAALLKEFGDHIKIKIDKQYREMKYEIADFISSNQFENLFEARFTMTDKNPPIENLTSYIHMSINRWFKSDQRLMELICYTFCSKYYKTQMNYSSIP